MQSVCTYCKKTSQPGTQFSKCSQCKQAFYCSKECQANDWKEGHKRTCKKPIEKYYPQEFNLPEINYENCSVTVNKKFRCTPLHLYEAFTNEKTISTYTQSTCKLTYEVGGGLSLYDGSIIAKYTEFKEHSYIKLLWKNKDWSDGVYSTVIINIKEEEPGVSSISISHDKIPLRDKFSNPDVNTNILNGWENLIFLKISKILGYGEIKED